MQMGKDSTDDPRKSITPPASRSGFVRYPSGTEPWARNKMANRPVGRLYAGTNLPQLVKLLRTDEKGLIRHHSEKCNHCTPLERGFKNVVQNRTKSPPGLSGPSGVLNEITKKTTHQLPDSPTAHFLYRETHVSGARSQKIET
ncbi:hypothetical protein ZHAS_00021408 [Anopheles sinensis]|uniref:Uncharacterized protein n=1 Tax=Anopheles sinensis TaxID=74873 RepID=A0A084WSC0_ANOSI|nr:hypothetical protein ZHAS_00021408 [Anopheles sinensis]